MLDQIQMARISVASAPFFPYMRIIIGHAYEAAAAARRQQQGEGDDMVA